MIISEDRLQRWKKNSPYKRFRMHQSRDSTSKPIIFYLRKEFFKQFISEVWQKAKCTHPPPQGLLIWYADFKNCYFIIYFEQWNKLNKGKPFWKLHDQLKRELYGLSNFFFVVKLRKPIRLRNYYYFFIFHKVSVLKLLGLKRKANTMFACYLRTEGTDFYLQRLDLRVARLNA